VEHHELLIIGGGNAGISLAARLLRDGAQDVAVVESEPVHRYRPLLNYVERRRGHHVVAGEACGEGRPQRVHVDQGPGGDGRRRRPERADPDRPADRLFHVGRLPRAREDWESTPGLAEAYAAGWAGSSFVVDSAPRVWPALRDLSAGRVLFTVPPEPAPCGATALKPLFMACDHWRRTGVLQNLDIYLVLPGTNTPRRARGRQAAGAHADVVRRAGAARGPGHRC
jgi:sulfide:quinone oxidoreductase